jgi:hypothetical protein
MTEEIDGLKTVAENTCSLIQDKHFETICDLRNRQDFLWGLL